MKRILLGFLFSLTLFLNPTVLAGDWSIRGNSSQININYSGGSGSSSFDQAFDSINDGKALPQGEFELPAAEEYNTIGNNTSIRDFIQKVLNFILSFLGLIAIIAIIYAGYMYIVAAGEDGQIEKAKKTIIYAIIGLIVVVVSYALVNTILKEAITGGDDREVSSGGNFTGNNSSGLVNSNRNSNHNGGLLSGGIYTGPSTVKTNYAPGIIIPAGTTLPNGVTLSQSSTVQADGTISVPSGSIQNIQTNDLPENQLVNDLLEPTTQILISGEDINDTGGLVVVSKESAKKGLTFGLSVQANARFSFGDGTEDVLDTIIEPNSTIVHKFYESGAYKIRVIAKTANGKNRTFYKELIVDEIKVDFRLFKKEVPVGEDVPLNAIINKKLSPVRIFKWHCEGGEGCFPDSTEESIFVSFGAPGTYEITLEAQNSFKTKGSITKSITVSADAPTANFKFRPAPNGKDPMAYEFSASDSLNSRGGTDGIDYIWSFEGEEKITNTPEVSYIFKSEGSHSVTLRVVESANGTTIESKSTTATVEVKDKLIPDFEISQ